MTRHSKEELANDMQEIVNKAIEDKYYITPRDIFAIGYMCGKFDLKRLINNRRNVRQSCEKYDKNDDLALLDTIEEVLVDLKVI